MNLQNNGQTINCQINTELIINFITNSKSTQYALNQNIAKSNKQIDKDFLGAKNKLRYR